MAPHPGKSPSFFSTTVCLYTHVRVDWNGKRSTPAHSLAGIKDVAQLLERCRMYEYPLHRLKIRLRPSPAAAPPHVPCDVTPCFGRLGQIIWPVRLPPCPGPTRADAAGGSANVQASDGDTGPPLPAEGAAPRPPTTSGLGRGPLHGPLPPLAVGGTPLKSEPVQVPGAGAVRGFTPTHGLMDDLDNMDWNWVSDTDSPPRKRSYTLSQGKEWFEQLEVPPFAA
eukprot:EG_transcript_21948